MVAADLEALQRTLAAEHAAVWVFGALGGRASSLPAAQLRAALAAAYDEHLGRRDRLRIVVASTGAQPVASEPAYRLPDLLTTPEQIAVEALRVQRGCVETYAALVAAGDGADRRWAVRAMAQTALTEAAFGGRPQALPGLTRS
jgi:hypothetical protein